MSTKLTELVDFCDQILDARSFKDYCPNGLQVEGRPEIERMAVAVTANQDVLEIAVKQRADALLVHHGYFWRGEPAPLVGMKKRRIETLLQHKMSLIAYHLPLDAHSELGNNAQLAKRLGIRVTQPLFNEAFSVGSVGELEQPRDLRRLVAEWDALSGHQSLLIGDEGRVIRKVAWCTGAAQDYIDRAAELNCELFISGEISERTVHSAREQNIAYMAAGHHATERYGVQALAAELARRFSLQWEFIDYDNPV
ncbi:MAG: Nif3-like dinuclear metal center hexameric protein [Pseudomonadota bacterium]